MCNKTFKPIVGWVDEKCCSKSITGVERSLHRHSVWMWKQQSFSVGSGIKELVGM